MLGFLAQYFIHLAVFPLCFDYSLHLLTVSWVSVLEAGQKGRHRVAQCLGCCIASCDSLVHQHWAPGEGQALRREPQPLLSTVIHCWLWGQIQLRMGWAWSGKKEEEEAEAHPDRWWDCRGSGALLMDNSLMNDWICFVFHCMLDLNTVLTKEIMGFLTKISCMSLLVHSK